MRGGPAGCYADRMARSTRPKPRLPRVPLPRQIGGVHPDRSKQLDRKGKHKKRVRAPEPE